MFFILKVGELKLFDIESLSKDHMLNNGGNGGT